MEGLNIESDALRYWSAQKAVGDFLNIRACSPESVDHQENDDKKEIDSQIKEIAKLLLNNPIEDVEGEAQDVIDSLIMKLVSKDLDCDYKNRVNHVVGALQVLISQYPVDLPAIY